MLGGKPGVLAHCLHLDDAALRQGAWPGLTALALRRGEEPEVGMPSTLVRELGKTEDLWPQVFPELVKQLFEGGIEGCFGRGAAS